MIAISIRNVQQALVEGAHQMRAHGVSDDSRNGAVVAFPGVWVTEYHNPTERVLLDPDRDANPFFHLFETLWMLAGRNDVKFPTLFNSKFAQFSDDGQTYHGAYGHRWRRHFGFDQIRQVAEALLENPQCRRQVLSIFDGRVDLGADTKDVPCNLMVTFQVDVNGELDMTVFNRSNDLIWGAYGSNAVHFSYLQEYVASMIGVPVGKYVQVSANTHVYQHHFDLLDKLADKAPMPPQGERSCAYSRGEVKSFPLMSTPVDVWDQDLLTFMEHGAFGRNYRDPFFEEVCKPLHAAWACFKDRSDPERFDNALAAVQGCRAEDWRVACKEWLQRRNK